jgi:hypothetical protein
MELYTESELDALGGRMAYLIDFRVVYRHAPRGTALEFAVVDYFGGAEP